METAIDKALELKRIAVVGLSRDPAKAAHSVPRYLQVQGYEIIPVNPHAGPTLLGEKVYKSLSEIPGDRGVDLVLIFRPSREALPFIEEALTLPNLEAVWLQEGIVSEEGQKLCQERGLLYVQDKCMFLEHRRRKRR